MSLIDSALSIVPGKYQNLVKQFFKFGVTGTIGAIVDFSIYGLLTRVVGFTSFYVILGQQISIANNISTVFAIISNFLFNKYWTFKDKEKRVWRQWVSYFTLNFITWILNQLIMSFLTYRVAIMATLFGSKKDLMAKVIAIGIILFLNFLGSKVFVFKSKTKTATIDNYEYKRQSIITTISIIAAIVATIWFSYVAYIIAKSLISII